MDKSFLIRFALKNLLIHRSRTILTLMGVMIGISAIVFLVAFAIGIENLVSSEVTKGDALKLIDVGTGSSKVVRLDNNTINIITDLNYVKDVQPIINAGATAKKEKNNTDITMFGTTNEYMEWSGIKIDQGQKLSDYDPQKKEVIVNESYLEFLEADSSKDVVGTEVIFDVVIPAEYSKDNKSITIEDQKYQVVGVIKSDGGLIAYTHYNALYELGAEHFSQLKVEVVSSNKIVELRKQIEGMGYKTEYVGDTIAQIEQIFGVFKLVLASFGLIALAVAALGMFNTLTISLMERLKEIALLKILGMNKKDITKIFIVESIIFGLSGGFLGIIFGIVTGKFVNFILNVYAVRSGGDPVTIFVFSPLFILFILIFSIVVGIVTGIYPSRKASRVSPLDVLRYE